MPARSIRRVRERFARAHAVAVRDRRLQAEEVRQAILEHELAHFLRAELLAEAHEQALRDLVSDRDQPAGRIAFARGLQLELIQVEDAADRLRQRRHDEARRRGPRHGRDRRPLLGAEAVEIAVEDDQREDVGLRKRRRARERQRRVARRALKTDASLDPAWLDDPLRGDVDGRIDRLRPLELDPAVAQDVEPAAAVVVAAAHRVHGPDERNRRPRLLADAEISAHRDVDVAEAERRRGGAQVGAPKNEVVRQAHAQIHRQPAGGLGVGLLRRPGWWRRGSRGRAGFRLRLGVLLPIIQARNRDVVLERIGGVGAGREPRQHLVHFDAPGMEGDVADDARPREQPRNRQHRVEVHGPVRRCARCRSSGRQSPASSRQAPAAAGPAPRSPSADRSHRR